MARSRDITYDDGRVFALEKKFQSIDRSIDWLINKIIKHIVIMVKWKQFFFFEKKITENQKWIFLDSNTAGWSRLLLALRTKFGCLKKKMFKTQQIFVYLVCLFVLVLVFDCLKKIFKSNFFFFLKIPLIRKMAILWRHLLSRVFSFIKIWILVFFLVKFFF